MSELQLRLVKVAIAALGCVFLLWSRWSTRPRWAACLRASLAVAAVTAYFHCFELPYDRYYHRWEMFHYYLGAKYSPELSYERLYRCVAVADAETGFADSVQNRKSMDLTTDLLVPARTWIDEPELCKRHFAGARWSAFVRDVVWFRDAAGGGSWWEQMQQDHGYNASPVWTLISHPLANLAPASDSFLRALAAIDLLLMAGSLVALAWAFGWELAATAVLFWGTQAASEFVWTGGAFLRQDWLFLCVLSVALLKKRYPFAAGVALAAAGLLRVFPLLLWAGPLLLILRRGKPSHTERRLLAGAAVCAIVALGAAGTTHGIRAYDDFARRLWLHAGTPISNHMSLRTVFAASARGRIEATIDASRFDPVEPWADARRKRSHELQLLQYATAAGILVCFAAAVWRVRRLWVAACLSLTLIPVLTDPSCYYYAFFILAVPLCVVRRDLSVMLLALSGAGQLLCLRFTWLDDRFVALAALYLVSTVALIAAFVCSPRAARAQHSTLRDHKGLTA